MRIPPSIAALAAWAALAVACASGETPDDPAADGFVPEADRWVDIMDEVIGPIYDDTLLGEAERRDGSMDFAAVAAQARRAADHMALGYGAEEWKNVPRFGEYAREAEAWLREIAAEADASDDARVRTLILDGELEHCDRCHAASR